MVARNYDGECCRNCCSIHVIGYNHDIQYLRSGWLRNIAETPLRCEHITKRMPDGAGGVVEVDIQQPVWVDSGNIGGTICWAHFNYQGEYYINGLR